jgi:hypothetical protein
MILNDLFESRMSDLDIEYQDYKNMEPVAFYSRYKMTPAEWLSKHWSLTKGSQTVHEGAMKDLHTELAEKYRELAPLIEKYKDSFLAGQLYDALESIAVEHDAELEFKRMMTGARNRAHMDYDTNPGGFQNWFWYLPFADENITEESQDDRNSRIIAGEIEDAMSQGNTDLAKQKIKELTKLGYYFDKQGRLQRMGMYEEQDACYRKVKSRYKVWPSAYASGALVQCRKKGAANWGNKTKK